MQEQPDKTPRDRRIARTKGLLHKAVISLIVERGEFYSIQISEITEKADVARSTFYLHYANKEELIYEALDSECNDFIANIQGNIEGDFAPIHLPSLLKYVHKYPDFFKVILNCVGTTQAYDRVCHLFQEWFNSYVDFSSLNPLVPKEVIVGHMANSVLGTIRWWLNHEDELPPETIDFYCKTLIFEGLYKTINVASREELTKLFKQGVIRAPAPEAVPS